MMVLGPHSRHGVHGEQSMPQGGQCSCTEPARFTLGLYSLSVVLTSHMSLSPEAPRLTAANVGGQCTVSYQPHIHPAPPAQSLR